MFFPLCTVANDVQRVQVDPSARGSDATRQARKEARGPRDRVGLFFPTLFLVRQLTSCSSQCDGGSSEPSQSGVRFQASCRGSGRRIQEGEQGLRTGAQLPISVRRLLSSFSSPPSQAFCRYGTLIVFSNYLLEKAAQLDEDDDEVSPLPPFKIWLVDRREISHILQKRTLE